MKATLLNKLGRLDENSTPLVRSEVDEPTPDENEAPIQVSAGGISQEKAQESILFARVKMPIGCCYSKLE